MKHKNILLTAFVVAGILMLHSCELAEELIGNETVSKIQGDWSCAENSEYFKSTTSVYSVTISPDGSNDNGVIIDGFYNLGDVGVKANAAGLILTLPAQDVEGGFRILTGTGTVAPNYNTITWTYNVNIGGDAVDHVTAVYTRIK